MNQDFFIRCYEVDDFDKVVNLFQKVSAVYPKAIFWWPGKDCNNWENVYCAFIDNQLIAKAQIEIVNIINENSSSNNKALLDNNLYNISSKMPPAADILEEICTTNYQAMPKQKFTLILKLIHSMKHKLIYLMSYIRSFLRKHMNLKKPYLHNLKQYYVWEIMRVKPKIINILFTIKIIII